MSDDMDAFLAWLDSLPKEPNDTVKAAFAAYKATVKPAPDVAELVEAAQDVDDFMRTDKAYERSGYGPKLRAALARIKEQKT